MAERPGKGKAGGRGAAKTGAPRRAGTGAARGTRAAPAAAKPPKAAIPPKRTGTAAAQAAARAKAGAKSPRPAPPTTATVRAAPRKAAPADRKALATAGPNRARARRPAPDPTRIERLVAAVVRSLEDDKAEAVVVLDVTGRASFTDRMILATGLADRQIQAMAAHLDEALGREGLKLRRDAIQASDDWVLIDAGDLVVHLFKPEKRAEIALEKMWGPDSPPGETTGQSPI